MVEGSSFYKDFLKTSTDTFDLRYDKVQLLGDWLIPSKNTKYHNTPPINVNQLSGFQYFTSVNNKYISFYAVNKTIEWMYNTESNLIKDYIDILSILTTSKIERI